MSTALLRIWIGEWKNLLADPKRVTGGSQIVLKMLSERISRCSRSRLQRDELAQLNPPVEDPVFGGTEGRKAAFNRGERTLKISEFPTVGRFPVPPMRRDCRVL